MNIIVKNSVKTGIFFLSCLLVFVNTAQPMFTVCRPIALWPKHPKKEFLVDRLQHPNLTGDAIYREKIFEEMTGMTESAFNKHLEIHNELPLLPSITQQLIDNLKHETISLGELRKSEQSKLIHNNGKFSILYLDVIKHPKKRLLVDVAALQASNPNAVFQTASRPNGLEGRQMSYQPNKNSTRPEDRGF